MHYGVCANRLFSPVHNLAFSKIRFLSAAILVLHLRKYPIEIVECHISISYNPFHLKRETSHYVLKPYKPPSKLIELSWFLMHCMSWIQELSNFNDLHVVCINQSIVVKFKLLDAFNWVIDTKYKMIWYSISLYFVCVLKFNLQENTSDRVWDSVKNIENTIQARHNIIKTRASCESVYRIFLIPHVILIFYLRKTHQTSKTECLLWPSLSSSYVECYLTIL